MAIQIPRYERQVGSDIGQAPSLSLPTPVEGAYGGGVAKAREGTAEVIGQMAGFLQKHAERQQKIKNDRYLTALGTQYTTEMQNMMLSSEEETYLDKDGVKQVRPKGYMLHQGNQSEGDTLRYDEQANALMNKYMNGLKGEELNKFASMANSQYTSGRSSVIGNEAKQNKIITDQIYTDSMQKKKETIALAASEPGLWSMNALSSILTSTKDEVYQWGESRGMTEQQKKMLAEEYNGGMVDTALQSSIGADITGGPAFEILEMAKDGEFITEEDYKDKMLSTKKMIDKQQEIAQFQITLGKMELGRDITNLIQTNEMTLENLNILKQQNPIGLDETMYNNAKKSIESIEAMTQRTDPSVYNNLNERLFDIFEETTATELRKEGADKKKYKEFMKLQAEVIGANANGQIAKDNMTTITKLMDAATTENEKFMKQYAPYKTELDRMKQWSMKVMMLNTRATGTAGVGVGKFLDEGTYQENVLMNVFGEFIEANSKGKKLTPVTNDTDAKALTDKANEAMYKQNVIIAHKLYDISTNADGKEIVTYDGMSFEVQGYSSGSPVINWEELDI